MELKKQGIWVKRMRDVFPNARCPVSKTLLYMTESTCNYDELEQADKWRQNSYGKYDSKCDSTCPKDAIRYCLLPSCIRLYRHDGECSFNPDMKAQ